jgi:MFS transporter, MHS family, alpha-ketoglutarate permease
VQHKTAFLTVLGFTAGGSLIFYTFTTYMRKNLVNTAGMRAKTASNVMTAALFVYMIMQPAFGALSDRSGRRTSMIWFGAPAILGTGPLLHALKGVTSAIAAFVLVGG